MACCTHAAHSWATPDVSWRMQRADAAQFNQCIGAQAGWVAIGGIGMVHICSVHPHAVGRALMQVKPCQSSRIRRAMAAVKHEAVGSVIPLQSPR